MHRGLKVKVYVQSFELGNEEIAAGGPSRMKTGKTTRMRVRTSTFIIVQGINSGRSNRW